MQMYEIMGNIQKYLSKNGIGYTANWEVSSNSGQISFWIGSKKHIFLYKNGKWRDDTEHIILTLHKMMDI